jgi:hypothetical protein
MRVPFSQIFQANPDGSISPKRAVHINGMTMGPGVAFGGGVSFGGVDITALRGRDLEVEYHSDVVVIKGFYQ